MSVDVKALRALLDKATPGPWRCDDGHVFCGPMADARHDAVMARVTAWQKGDKPGHPVGVDPREHVATCPQENPDVAANEELIVAAVNALPDLLALAEAVRELAPLLDDLTHERRSARMYAADEMTDTQRDAARRVLAILDTTNAGDGR